MDPVNESKHDRPAGIPPNDAASEPSGVALWTLEGLRLSATVLSILYVAYAYLHSRLPGDISRVLVPWALCSSLLLLAIRWQLKPGDEGRPSIHIYSVAVAVIVLCHGFVVLALTRNPSQSVSLVLLLVGSSYIFLSRSLLGGLVVVVLIGWVVVAGPEVMMSSWRDYGMALISAATLGFILQTTRLHTYGRLESLRRQADDRALALRQRARHLETLISVGHSINGFLNVDALLDYVVETLHTSFGYDYVGIFLTDETGRYLDSRAGTGVAAKQLLAEGCRLEVGKQGLVGWVSRYREPVCVNDVTRDDRYLKVDLLATTQAEMVVPLGVGDALLGVLDLQSDRVDAFSAEDFRVCCSLADQVSTALQNASMYESERSRRSLMETLYRVGRALSQTLDVGEVLDLILSSLETVVAFDVGIVALHREGMLKIVAGRGFPDDVESTDEWLAIRDGGAYQVICETKQPLSIADVADLPAWEYSEVLPNTRAWVGLPLIDAEDAVIGILSLSRATPDPYSSAEVASSAAFAGQAGIALHNAQLYLELSEAYRRLRSLDSAKSDFITLASHELRTPLTLVTGYSHMLLEEPLLAQQSSLYSMAQGVAIGAGRLQQIVDRMMDLAEIESQSLQLEFAPTLLHSLMLDVVQQVSAAASQRHIHVVLEDFSALAAIEADQASLGKAFRQLVMNAIKYTPDGGQVLISGEVRLADQEGLSGQCVEITVADTGIGIDPVHHERIFDKFYNVGHVGLHSSGTVKFRGGGPGLGLAIVKGIVTAHRGDIWVESDGLDVDACPGSRFHVLLPVVQPVLGEEMRLKFLQNECPDLEISRVGEPESSGD